MIVLSATEGSMTVIIKNFIDRLSILRTICPACDCFRSCCSGSSWCAALASFGADYLEAYAVQKVTLDIRAELNEALQHKPLSFFNRTPTGVMMSRVINDVQLDRQRRHRQLFSIFSDSTLADRGDRRGILYRLETGADRVRGFSRRRSCR